MLQDKIPIPHNIETALLDVMPICKVSILLSDSRISFESRNPTTKVAMPADDQPLTFTTFPHHHWRVPATCGMWHV